MLKIAIICRFRKRPSIQQLLDHPWVCLNSTILAPMALKATTEGLKATPLSQRKSMPSITTEPPTKIPQKKLSSTFCSDNLKSKVATAYVCFCPQCETSRHRSHTIPVPKTTLTVDRGIKCQHRQSSRVKKKRNLFNKRVFGLYMYSQFKLYYDNLCFIPFSFSLVVPK